MYCKNMSCYFTIHLDLREPFVLFLLCFFNASLIVFPVKNKTCKHSNKYVAKFTYSVHTDFLEYYENSIYCFKREFFPTQTKCC